jgi:tetratricopeptide (TPR) repeat protein
MIQSILLCLLLLFSFPVAGQEEELSAEPVRPAGQTLQDSDSLKNVQQPGADDYQSALALRNRFDYPGSVAAVQQALSHDSANMVYLAELADLYQVMGNYPDAIRIYRKALEKEPGDPFLRANLGKLWIRLQEYREAYAVFSVLHTEDSVNLWIQKQLAISASRLGKSGEAVTLFMKVLQQNPGDFSSSLAVASLLQQDTAYSAACEVLLGALREFPGNSLLQHRLAQNYYYLNEYENAAEMYQEYLSHNDTSLIVRKEYGVVLYFCKREQEAIGILTPAGYMAPADPLIPFYIGLSYRNLKDFPEAKEYLESAAGLSHPWYMTAVYRNLAQVHGFLREFPQAMEVYKKILEIDPSDHEVLFEMATTSEEYMRDKTVAYGYYRQYLEKAGKRAPNEAYARSRMSKIREELFFDDSSDVVILPD